MPSVVPSYLLAAGASRQVLKYVWQPKKSVQHYTHRQIPYDDLFVGAVLSKLAYKPKDEMMIWNAQDSVLSEQVARVFVQNEKDLCFFQGRHDLQDTQVYVWKKNNSAHVVFRGTESKEDWMANLDIRKKEFELFSDVDDDRLEVHNGFKRQFYEVEDRLTQYLRDNKDDIRQINFYGHSLGMACSILGALYYYHYFHALHQPKSIRCFTYGGPRVGSRHFAHHYMQQTDLAKNTWRVVDTQDVVPMVPLSHRFHHIPCNTIKLGEAQRFEYSPRDVFCFTRPLHLLTMMNLADPIHYHDIDNYIEKIKRIALINRETKI